MGPEDSFAALMGRLRAGDPAAADEVFGAFAARLAGLARRRLGARARRQVDPEDVLQSAFHSFFRRQADGRVQPQSREQLWALLVTLTLRKCGARVDYLQAACRDARREVAAGGDSAGGYEALAREPTPAEAAALADLVEGLMRDFEGRERRILSLRLQGFTAEEIKAEVGCSERTVYRVLDRARKRLERLHGDADQSPTQAPPEPGAGASPG
jgi:RNA polymerase sigma-70 factor (ECF subfamily)